MSLSDAPLLFAFEIESSEDFTYIPMIVRFHLDRGGLRISLDQWQLLPIEDRKLLARFPADVPVDPDMAADRESPEPSPGEVGFSQALAEMLRTHGCGEAEVFAPEPAPAWQSLGAPPAALAAQCALAALPVPSPSQWAALGGFERYVLAKLSRKPKLNHDFVPAMREFGLAGA
ncbi:nitrate reductase associated protein [Burkholderia gladioli]|uniref:nitrate reductase associated protein n=1 Tax=Burkholderia gladioli TaxID=28095 RepID=UPI003DA3D23A